jgi:hypothetical protein
MKKRFVIIGMVFVILCGCIGCAVANELDIDGAKEAAVTAMIYVEENYDEGCDSYAIGLNETNREEFQTLFDEDLTDVEAVVVVCDENGEAIDLFAVNY